MPSVWTLVVRARRVLVRPMARRLVALSVAVLTGLTVTSLLRATEAERDRWGERRSVAVALRDLQPGDVLDGGAAQLQELPDVAVPAAALSDVPVGAIVRQPIASGEPLVAERLAPDGLDGVAALVPVGHRAVSIPLGPAGAPPVRLGDHVDLLAVVPAAGPAFPEHPAEGEPAPAVPLVEGALVVDVTEQAVSVAIRQAQAPTVAYAVTNGIVLVALAGADVSAMGWREPRGPPRRG